MTKAMAEALAKDSGKRDFDDLIAEINHFLSATDIFVVGDQKLLRMENLMKALGDPQNKVRAVHVAGTSGKTSTAYFAAEFLRQQGFAVGLSVSPHIEDVRERAQVNGELLDRKVYVEHLTEFLSLVRAAKMQPSYFEFYMGFFYWLCAKLELDFMVVETGLGGLYDGSNVITRPDKVCVITDIGFDHVEILGGTLAEIAGQKAGIIHAGNSVFMYEQTPEVMAAVQERCAEVGATIQIVQNVKLQDFQARNAHLSEVAVQVTLGVKKKMIGKIQVPARAEEFMWHGKKVILDGAHNPQKLRAFVEYAKPRFGIGAGSCVLLASFGANKAASLDEDFAILRELGDYVVLASFQDKSLETNFRESLPFDVMEAAARKAGFKAVEIAGGAKSALQLAFTRAEQLGAENIIAVGSFFLAADARQVVKAGDEDEFGG
jgi:dihydrofolate synthase/folylpolyglutamate synthase